MADPNQEQAASQHGGQEPANAGQQNQGQQTQTPPAQAADVQAQIDAALSAQQAAFAKQLKEATGHDDLKALTEANLKAQGKLQELADSRGQEAQTYKTKFEQTAISNALLQAATDAVDPSVVGALLAGKAVCDDNGSVTIDGKPVADAVKALLAEKPFLAKAQGGTGSGAPNSMQGGKQTSRDQFNALSPQARADHLRNGGTVI